MMLRCQVHREGSQEWKISSRLEPHKERLKSVSVLYATLLGGESIQPPSGALCRRAKNTLLAEESQKLREDQEDGGSGSAAASQQ